MFHNSWDRMTFKDMALVLTLEKKDYDNNSSHMIHKNEFQLRQKSKLK